MTDLERVLAGAPREPLVLALFDLNGFKQYNDAFGHPAGDALLARLGRSAAARGRREPAAATPTASAATSSASSRRPPTATSPRRSPTPARR